MKQQVVSLQFAMFFSEEIHKPYSIFEDINKAMMNIFNGMPQIMDLPSTLPSDVPLITYRSDNNEYVCNISRSRIDLFVQNADGKKENAKIVADFNNKTESFAKYVLSKTKINRFGMVCRYFFPNVEPVSVIGNKYLKTPIQKGLTELTIRFNTPTESDGLVINDMVEISAVNAVVQNQTHSGIFIQRDINNQLKEDSPLSIELLGKISKTFSPLVSEEGIEALIK